jgi:hypothetical protein
MFLLLNSHLGDYQFRNNKEVEMAVGKLLWMHMPSLYCDGIFKLVPRWDRCIKVVGKYRIFR